MLQYLSLISNIESGSATKYTRGHALQLWKLFGHPGEFYNHTHA